MKSKVIVIFIMCLVLTGCSKNVTTFEQDIVEVMDQEINLVLRGNYFLSDPESQKEIVNDTDVKGFKHTYTYVYKEAQLSFESYNGIVEELVITNRDTFYNTALAYQELKIREKISSYGYDVSYYRGYPEVVSFEVRNPVVSAYARTGYMMFFEDYFDDAAYQRYLNVLPTWFDLRDEDGSSTISGSPLYLYIATEIRDDKMTDVDTFMESILDAYPNANLHIDISEKNEETKTTTRTHYYFHEGIMQDLDEETFIAYDNRGLFDFGSYLLDKYEGYNESFQLTLLERAMLYKNIKEDYGR